ncbi:MAG: dipeptidyl-peptidase-4 [Flavobacteriaceae bacterium]|jgi:dipeptidyl-peptidase-4
MKKIFFLLTLNLLVSSNARSQDTLALSAYESAVSFLGDNLYTNRVFNFRVLPNWFPDDSGFWYTTDSPTGTVYEQYKYSWPDTAPLFDHEKLADILGLLLNESFDADDLPISKLTYIDANLLEFTINNVEYAYAIDADSVSQKITIPPAPEISGHHSMSPDSSWIAYTENYNLFIKSSSTGEIRQLSTSGIKNYEYGSMYGWGDIMEGESDERPEHFYAEWSEDGKWIMTMLCDLRSAQKMYLLDHSFEDIYRPKLLSYYRGSPGDTAMVYHTPVFFNVPTGEEVHIDLPRTTHINPYDVALSTNSEEIYLIKLERGYKTMNIYRFNLASKQRELIYTETSETNIDAFDYEETSDHQTLFILSEKSGWRQLYSFGLASQKEIAITDGSYYINSIEYVDEINEKLYFLASGKEPGVNPYFQNLYSISFDGKDLKLLTSTDYHHEIDISPDSAHFVDNASTISDPTRSSLNLLSTGEDVHKIRRADISNLGKWIPPVAFSTIGRNGTSTIYGALYKPTSFDENKSYPIIDASYTGPHTQVFPKSFRRAFHLQALAELGFIVVCIDGLGSSGRSKAFHDYSYRNLGGNLEDHVLAIQRLGRKHNWIDTNRVGIYGHSAGGYDAGHAMLQFPDFYKVAVASSGDHDHRMEKAWWPEMYMGWPVDSAYHQQSNVTMAGNLKGKLLLVHGGIDENVNPSATFKLADALVMADKKFDLLILPSQRHGYVGQYRSYFTKIRWNYFVEHLLGVKSRWEIPFN